MDYRELSKRIKEKYPEYQGVEDRELAQKIVAKYPEYKDTTFDSPKSAFQRFGSALPVAGSVLGGLAGGTAGTAFGMGLGGVPGAMGGAALGAAGGESARQILGKMMGEPSPATPGQAASGIGKEAILGAAGEGVGGLVGKGLGAAYKGVPGIGQMFSGTPKRNLAKAQLRGFAETYFPKSASGITGPKGVSRETAGATKGAVENRVLNRHFKPEEIAKMKLRKSGFSDQIVEDSLIKFIKKEPLSPKEAVGTVKAIDVIYKDTPAGAQVAPELAQLRRYADAVLSKSEPVYKDAKRVSESTILRSQLTKPLRVNKTRPDEYSGFTGAIMPAVAGAILGTQGFSPEAIGTAGIAAGMSSPMAFGVLASILGSGKRGIPAIVRKTLGRTGGQAGIRSAVDALMSKRQ